MAYEPRMPTVEEIREKAIALFNQERFKAGLPALTPEDEELKEGNYWLTAQRELMSGVREELERYLADLKAEVTRIEEELGIEKPPPVPERLKELEYKLGQMTIRYEDVRERLRESDKEIKRLEEELRRKPAPPTLAPPKAAPPPPVEKGLGRDEEKRLLTRFEAMLLERTITPGRWRPMFNDRLYEWRDAFKDLPREEALSRALVEVERLVADVAGLAKPPVRPPVVRPPVVPEEVPPIPPVPVFVPVPPPPGMERRWGMPWAMFECPAHLGEGGPPDQLMVLRSKYLEARLIRLGLPTGDELFYELCDYHRQRYGGAFEKYPRYKVEFWVGEAIAKAEIDVATLVGLGISEEYCLYALDFYETTKHLAIQ